MINTDCVEVESHVRNQGFDQVWNQVELQVWGQVWDYLWWKVLLEVFK